MHRDLGQTPGFQEAEVARRVLNERMSGVSRERLAVGMTPPSPHQELQVVFGKGSLTIEQVPRLNEFVRGVYANRDVAIARVHVRSGYIDLHVDDQEPTRTPMDRMIKGLRVHIPEQEVLLDTSLYLFPQETPMTYGIKRYTAAELAREQYLPFDYTFDRQPLDARIVAEIAEMVPPLPIRRWSFGRRPFEQITRAGGLVVVGPNFESLKSTW